MSRPSKQKIHKGIWHSECHSQERRKYLRKPPSKKPVFLAPDLCARFMRDLYLHSLKCRKIFSRNYFSNICQILGGIHLGVKTCRPCICTRANPGKILANCLCVGFVPRGTVEEELARPFSFLPPPLPPRPHSPGNFFPQTPSSWDLKLFCLVEEPQSPGAWVRGGVRGGLHSKTRNLLKEWLARIGQKQTRK